jgi:hypothetical protein
MVRRKGRGVIPYPDSHAFRSFGRIWKCTGAGAGRSWKLITRLQSRKIFTGNMRELKLKKILKKVLTAAGRYDTMITERRKGEQK